jgi:hypothetical protein
MKAYAIVLTGLTVAAAVAIPAFAQEDNALPPSGSFKTHTGAKLTGDSVEVAKGHFLISGLIWGVAYNDAGSGPLHTGAVVSSSMTRRVWPCLMGAFRSLTARTSSI